MRKRNIVELSIGKFPFVKLDGRELSGGHGSTCKRIKKLDHILLNAR
jgi:hypothetical protein